MHNDELRNLKTFPDIRITSAQRMRWTRHVALVEEKKYGYNFFFWKDTLGRSSNRWKYNTKMEPYDIGGGLV